MHLRTLLPALLALVIVSTESFAAPAAPPTPDQLARAAAALPASTFFSLPNVRLPELSPDGTKIAFLFPLDHRMALGVFDRQTKEARLVVRGTDESIRSFAWKGNAHLVFFADYHGNESYFIGTTDLSGKTIRRIAESFGAAGASWSQMEVVNWLPTDMDNIVLAGWIGSDPEPRVVKLNVTTGDREGLYSRPMDKSRQGYGNYVVDGRGQVRFVSIYEDGEVRLMYRDSNTAPFTEMHREPIAVEGRRWDDIYPSCDGRKIFVLDYEGRDRGALRLFDAASRRLTTTLFEPPEGEITGVIWNTDWTDLVGVAYESDRLHFHWFDAAEQQLREKLEATFPGLTVRVVSRSLDNQVRLVWVGSDREPGVYFVLDLRAGSMVEFKRVRSLDPRLMRPMEPVAFKARDGLEIHGYLTRPFAATRGPVPLIVYPHGGPFTIRDEWEFNPDVQFLASRGYAVLQVNYRGSGGYGRAFVLKGRCEWGRGMQNDLTDGVKWCIDQKIADPKHVAIYGGSYGGFAAIAGVTLTPELYCCAVNYVGVVDLEITGHNAGEDAWLRRSDFDFQREWVGPTEEYRNATNPIRFIDRIRVPTLHIYGRNDPRVNSDHWQRLEAQLRKYHKPYETLIKRDEGHGFDDEADVIELNETIEKFFAKHLRPEAVPASSTTN